MPSIKTINAQCQINTKGPYKIGGIVPNHDNTTAFNPSNASNRSSDLCEAVLIGREEGRLTDKIR